MQKGVCRGGGGRQAPFHDEKLIKAYGNIFVHQVPTSLLLNVGVAPLVCVVLYRRIK